MMHSSTACASTPARRTASPTASAPSWVAVNDFSAPRNLPVGVRTADTITVSVTLAHRDGDHRVWAQERLQAPQNDRRRACHLARPEPAGGVDDERFVDQPDVRLSLDRRPDRGPPRKRHLAGGE